MDGETGEVPEPNVIIPETGAGKYWYVDPKASKQYDPKEQRVVDEQQFEKTGVVPMGENPQVNSSDAFNAALKMTFPSAGANGGFPGARLASEQSDLLKETEGIFYGGGQAVPTATPTPSPVKPTQMSLADLYNHFGVPNPSNQYGSTRPVYQNKPDTQVYNWQNEYGFGSALT